MRANYVLIDYENIQTVSVDVLDQEHFHVIVFVGANQSKVSIELASALQRMGTRASYLKITGNGSNALDFHIAFYIGQLAAADPAAYFHIISKDSGFDPLIAHLKTKKIYAARSRDISEMPIVKAATARTAPDRVPVVIAKLQQLGASKPRTVKTLSSTVSALFQKSLTDDEISGLLQHLQKQGVVTVTESKVSYALPA